MSDTTPRKYIPTLDQFRENPSAYKDVMRNMEGLKEQAKAIIGTDPYDGLDEMARMFIESSHTSDLGRVAVHTFLDNGGTIRSLYENEDESLSENAFVKFIREDGLNENSKLYEAFETAFGFRLTTLLLEDIKVPTEKELGVENDEEFQDLKKEKKTFWERTKNSWKKLMKLGFATIKAVKDALKNPMKLIKDVGKEFAHAFEILIDAGKKAVKAMADQVKKAKGDELEKHVSGHKHVPEEKTWYKEVTDWLMKWGKEIIDMIVSAASKGASSEDLNKTEKVDKKDSKNEEWIDHLMNGGFQRLFESHMNRLMEAGDHEDFVQLDLVHDLASEDSSFVKKYKELSEALSMLVKNCIDGMIELAAKGIEKLSGPKALESYPVSSTILAAILEVVSSQTTGISTWNFDIKKVILAGIKSIVIHFISPTGWIYHMIVFLKYAMTVEHLLAEFGVGHGDHGHH